MYRYITYLGEKEKKADKCPLRYATVTRGLAQDNRLLTYVMHLYIRLVWKLSHVRASSIVKAMINGVKEPLQINKVYTIKGTLFI